MSAGGASLCRLDGSTTTPPDRLAPVCPPVGGGWSGDALSGRPVGGGWIGDASSGRAAVSVFKLPGSLLIAVVELNPARFVAPEVGLSSRI